jgi:hypothetical protein
LSDENTSKKEKSETKIGALLNSVMGQGEKDEIISESNKKRCLSSDIKTSN